MDCRALGVAAAGCCGAAACAYLIFYPKQRFIYRRIRGPYGEPLTGNLRQMLAQDMTCYLQACEQEYGKLFKVWLGATPYVVVSDVDAARRLMSRLLVRPNIAKWSLLVGEAADVNDAGLLNIHGAAWRRARKAFEAAIVHPKALAMHTETMAACVERLLRRLDARVGLPEVNVGPLMGDMTLEVVGECAFGVNFNTQCDEDGSSGSTAGATVPSTGRELADAIQLVFDVTKVDRSSAYMKYALWFPPLAPLIRWAANTWPDARQAQAMHARQVMIDVSRALVARWREQEQEQAQGASHHTAAAQSASPSQDAATIACDGAMAAESGDDDGATVTIRVRGKPQGGVSVSVKRKTNGPVADGEPNGPPVSAGGTTSALAGAGAGAGEHGSSKVAGDLAGGGMAGAAAGGGDKAAGGQEGAQDGINRRSFMALLLGSAGAEGGGGLSDLEVVGQVFTFLMVGYETTAYTLMYTVHLLAAHPEVQEKLASEATTVLSTTEGQAALGKGADALYRAFPYTSAVIDEVLRLYPTAVNGMRMTASPTEVDGTRIPAGSWLYLPIFSFHRDPSIWPRASEFLPERHLRQHLSQEQVEAGVQPQPLHPELQPNNPNAYMPFGVGARSCPGARFALQEARLAVITMAQRFRFELPPGVPRQLKTRTRHIIMFPPDGVRVRVVRREQ